MKVACLRCYFSALRKHAKRGTMRTVALAIITLVVGYVAMAQPTHQQTWGLCIGISEYDPESLSLKWADKDAIEFSSTFLKYGLNLPEDHYRILKNREATRENILEHLGWLNMSADKRDRVYIFYSGHGKSYSPILPHDSYNTLSLKEIKKALRKIDAQDIIFFADACYSGKLAGKGTKSAVEQEGLTGLSKGLVIDMAQARSGTVIMTSANGIQQALERKAQKNGIFTHHLMNTLMIRRQVADTNYDGKLTLYEVYQDVYNAVVNTPGSKQQPQISDPNKAKQIVLFTYSPLIPSTQTSIASSLPEFRITQVIIKDERGKAIEPVNGIYSIKVGETVTVRVNFTTPDDYEIRVTWTTRHGNIPSISQKTTAYTAENLYTAEKSGSDYVIVYIWDKETGEELQEPINITVVP